MNSDTERKERELAQALVRSLSVADRELLAVWVKRMLAISNSQDSRVEKARKAVVETVHSRVAFNLVKALFHELKRLGWEERSTKWRIALGAAVTTAVVTGGQGAGIAALGGAIGVPLWLMVGGGAAFLRFIYEEVTTGKQTGEVPDTGSPPKNDKETIDVEASVVTDGPTVTEPYALESKRGIVPGDTLKCRHCGNAKLITQTWLDTLLRRYEPTSAGRLTSLDSTYIRRLKCSQCGEKSLDLLIGEGSSTLAYQLCGACGGDGGVNGRCYKCFGTGFQQT